MAPQAAFGLGAPHRTGETRVPLRWPVRRADHTSTKGAMMSPPTVDPHSRTSWSRPLAAFGTWLALAAAIVACAAALPPLTTISNNPQLPGKFVWVDLVTYDVAAASAFYARLFGWRFRDLGNYSMAFNEERPLAGIFQRPRPENQAAKPRWIGYISVPNVERAQQSVTEAGGKVLVPPQKMPQRGEQAVFADPEGALFGVVTSSSGDPEDVLPDIGDWIWMQLLSRDARKASEFYRAVAGYEIIPSTTPGRLRDFVLASEDYARATVRTLAKTDTAIRPVWLPFVRVRSVPDSVALAKQLGGKVWIEPRPDLLDGKVAVITDPTGAAIGLLDWSREESKGGG